MNGIHETTEQKIRKPEMLLHVCCANCVLYPVNALKESFDISLYFYNPNIYPEDEYEKRLYYVKKVARLYKLPLKIGNYENRLWFDLTDSYKNEPEGSKRCEICYSLRLEKTAGATVEGNFKIFTTTLSVSPHKNSATLNRIGAGISRKYNIPFYAADFKKKDGYRKTIEISKHLSIYRQDYCGCMYSIRKKELR